MKTQIFEDGSNLIYGNVKSDNSKLNLICNSLSSLTEKDGIINIINQLKNKNILNDKDFEFLLSKFGIKYELNLEKNINDNLKNNKKIKNNEER